MNKGEQRAAEPVHSITGAVSPHSDDLDARIRRYLISMSIRVLCVVLAIWIHAQFHHWSWWIFAIGAVILPYVAVVMANAVDPHRGKGAPPPVTPSTRFVLPSTKGSADAVDEDVVITIHPPERPIGGNSSDSARSDPAFDDDEPTSLADSSRSPEQSK